MTERDIRAFKRMLYFLPIVTIIVSLLIQWGSWTANSANLVNRFAEQKVENEKRFERIEHDKANNDVVETKFNNIDWKLDLIMKNLGITYKNKTEPQ